MNILIDELPSTVTVGGNLISINSDFRTSILFELMMQDSEMSNSEKLEATLELYYRNTPSNLEEAINKAIWFYKCGKEDTKQTANVNMNRQKQIYSYEYDAEYIYSAFLSQYRIDLQDIDGLHWWKFKAMFQGLNESNEIVKIMGYRALDLSKIKDKEQKAHYRKLKNLYRLPDNRTEEQKESMVADAFASLF